MDKLKDALVFAGVSLTATILGTAIIKSTGILVQSTTHEVRIASIESRQDRQEHKLDALLLHFKIDPVKAGKGDPQ